MQNKGTRFPALQLTTKKQPPEIASQSGQSIVVITLALVALLAFAGLIFDTGTAYAQHRRMQNAADAGAIAGARQVVVGGTNCSVYNNIYEYAITRNGTAQYGGQTTSFQAYYLLNNHTLGAAVACDGGNPPSNALGVQVSVNTTLSTFFLGVLGVNNNAVRATAGGAFGSIASPGNQIQPLTRKCDEPSLAGCGFQFGQTYDLWQSGGSGNFGWLGWDGCTTAGCIENELAQGYTITNYIDPHHVCSSVAIDCWVQGSPGVNNSSGINAELSIWQSLGLAGKPMIITIFDTTEGSGSNVNYHIVGFAAFTLSSFDLPGKHMYGQFIQWTTAGAICDGCMTTGLTSVHLISSVTP